MYSTASLHIYETKKLEICLKMGIEPCPYGTTVRHSKLPIRTNKLCLWRELKPDPHALKPVRWPLGAFHFTLRKFPRVANA